MSNRNDIEDVRRVLSWLVMTLAVIAACVMCYRAGYNARFTDAFETVTEEFEIVKIHPPKHFHLDLKSVETGEVFERVYVSKHMNEYRKLKIGSKFTMTRTRRIQKPDPWCFDHSELQRLVEAVIEKETSRE